MTMLRISLWLFFLVVSAILGGKLWAEDILPDRNSGFEQHVIIKTNASKDQQRPSVYQLKDQIVEEETDSVKRALNVFKKRSEPQQVKRLWVTDRKSGQKRLIVEYAPRSGDDKIIFSQDEKFMYYLGVAPGGQNIVYGVDLLSNRKFSTDEAGGFNMLNCPDQKSYLVVQDGQQLTVYNIYTVAGKKLDTLRNIQNPVDIEKELCR